MASKADESTSNKNNILPENKKLYWKETGESNLIEWETDLLEALKAEFGIYYACIVGEAIPREWTEEYVYEEAVFGRPYEELSALRKRILDLEIGDYYDIQFS